jgi:formate dehydrogenase major subunit
MKTTGKAGLINADGNICRFPKFGYRYLSDTGRITKPLQKINGRFKEITFEKAFDLIAEKIKAVKADDNAFFAGARLTNEEMYLIQKLARTGAKTNNVTSFHYLNRGDGYIFDSAANVPFDQIAGASKIYLVGSEINRDNAVAGFLISNSRYNHGTPLELVTTHANSPMQHKADRVLRVKSYYHFIKAVNYYLVANHFENRLFINDKTKGYEEYKQSLLKENFVDLVEKSGVEYMDMIIEFAKEFNKEMNAVIVYSEKELCSTAASELKNLAMITGKLGKSSNGLIALKEKNNSQGLFDMGICPKLGIGSLPVLDKDLQAKMKEKWGVKKLPETINVSQFDSLEKGMLKNIFIFGEDPLGCSQNKVKVAGWLSVADFIVVQDYFMTETAKHSDLVLPASLPFETGGSFTNTQKVIQEFDAVLPSKVEIDSFGQLNALLGKFGITGHNSPREVMMEAVSLLPSGGTAVSLRFIYTQEQNCNRMFNYGCDVVVKRFEEHFDNALKQD